MKPLFVGRGSLRVSAFYFPHSEGCQGHIVFRLCVCAYMLMYICLSVPSVRDPVRLTLNIFVTASIKFYFILLTV